MWYSTIFSHCRKGVQLLCEGPIFQEASSGSCRLLCRSDGLMGNYVRAPLHGGWCGGWHSMLINIPCLTYAACPYYRPLLPTIGFPLSASRCFCIFAFFPRVIHVHISSRRASTNGYVVFLAVLGILPGTIRSKPTSRSCPGSKYVRCCCCYCWKPSNFNGTRVMSCFLPLAPIALPRGQEKRSCTIIDTGTDTGVQCQLRWATCGSRQGGR